jgi:hypothetical protein
LEQLPGCPMSPVFPDMWAPFNGIVSFLTTKCWGNVHDKGAVKMTASSVVDDDIDSYPRNAAHLGDTDSNFTSADKTGQWIYWDFKTLRIEPTRYTIGSRSLKG